jgi:hypothetical protein
MDWLGVWLNLTLDMVSQTLEKFTNPWIVGHVSPGIEPGGFVFPSQNNNIVLCLFGVLQAMWKLEIFSSARGRL